MLRSGDKQFFVHPGELVTGYRLIRVTPDEVTLRRGRFLRILWVGVGESTTVILAPPALPGSTKMQPPYPTLAAPKRVKPIHTVAAPKPRVKAPLVYTTAAIPSPEQGKPAVSVIVNEKVAAPMVPMAAPAPAAPSVPVSVTPITAPPDVQMAPLGGGDTAPPTIPLPVPLMLGDSPARLEEPRPQS